MSRLLHLAYSEAPYEETDDDTHSSTENYETFSAEVSNSGDDDSTCAGSVHNEFGLEILLVKADLMPFTES